MSIAGSDRRWWRDQRAFRAPSVRLVGRLVLGSLLDVLRRLLRALLDLLGVLLAALLDRLLRALRGVLRNLLAVLERLLAGLADLLLHVVGDRADLLVFDARGRDQHAREEPDGNRADRETERILLRHARGLAGLVLDLAGIRRAADDLVLDAHDALLGRFLLVLQVLLGARLDVGLVTERVDGVRHLGARLFYLGADPVGFFAHWMSSFTVSTVWGAGGVARCNCFWPALASTRATIAHSAITISEATHVAIASSSSVIRAALSAPSASSPAAAAPPSMPAPLPATLPFCCSSAWASWISLRTRVEVCWERSLTSSPIPRSRGSPAVSWGSVV